MTEATEHARTKATGLPRWLSGKGSACQVQFLGQENPLEKEMATHSSLITWEIPWWATVHGVANKSDTTQQLNSKFGGKIF